ncbi:MAG: hypothetical protein GY711_06030 [bacterium]|nr:hypothetical protein [bacterium]
MERRQLELASMIQSLRRELLTAMEEGDDEPLRFELGDVELEVQVAVESKEQGEVGVKFWVLQAGVGEEFAHSQRQTLKITLHPKLAGGGAANIAASAAGRPG